MTAHEVSESADEPSKTKRKLEAVRLRKLGKSLTELSPIQLASLPLSEELMQAIRDFHRFPTREAKRRQLQRIGKIVRSVESDAIEQALEELAGVSAAARYSLHRLERWRDQLLTDPGALTEYLQEHPHADRQQLRQLLRKAANARNEAEQRANARLLFKFLRGVEEESTY